MFDRSVSPRADAGCAASAVRGRSSRRELPLKRFWIAQEELADFPGLVREAAKLREPHRIVFYVQELARDFQSYFTRLKGEGDPILPQDSTRARPGWDKEWDFGKTRARLAWIEAIRGVYAASLDLVGVTAPERMDRPDDADPLLSS